MDNNNNKVNGHKKAFLRQFMDNQRQLYFFILSLCPNYSEADDILQETALVLWDKFEELEDEDGFLPWAFQIARFKILNHRRKKTAALWLSDELLDKINAETAKQIENTSAVTDALEKCLKLLTEKDQKLLNMRYRENISFLEISKIVNRSVNGLYNASARIHQKLRSCINKSLKLSEAK